jgi:hypothetical protein
MTEFVSEMSSPCTQKLCGNLRLVVRLLTQIDRIVTVVVCADGIFPESSSRDVSGCTEFTKTSGSLGRAFVSLRWRSRVAKQQYGHI